MNERQAERLSPLPMSGGGLGEGRYPFLGQGGLGSCDHHDKEGGGVVVITGDGSR